MTLADEFLKLLSPPYVAVSVLDPAVMKVKEQLPPIPGARALLQDSPVPEVTVTLPVGPPFPNRSVTLKLTITGCPTSEGFGVLLAIVILLALLTCRVTAALAVVKSVVSFGVKLTDSV